MVWEIVFLLEVVVNFMSQIQSNIELGGKFFWYFANAIMETSARSEKFR